MELVFDGTEALRPFSVPLREVRGDVLSTTGKGMAWNGMESNESKVTRESDRVFSFLF